MSPTDLAIILWLTEARNQGLQKVEFLFMSFLLIKETRSFPGAFSILPFTSFWSELGRMPWSRPAPGLTFPETKEPPMWNRKQNQNYASKSEGRVFGEVKKCLLYSSHNVRGPFHVCLFANNTYFACQGKPLLRHPHWPPLTPQQRWYLSLSWQRHLAMSLTIIYMTT